MIRRWLCRLGRHDVLRCAGRADHAWTWIEPRGRRDGHWSARVDGPAR